MHTVYANKNKKNHSFFFKILEMLRYNYTLNAKQYIYVHTYKHTYMSEFNFNLRWNLRPLRKYQWRPSEWHARQEPDYHKYFPLLWIHTLCNCPEMIAMGGSARRSRCPANRCEPSAPPALSWMDPTHIHYEWELQCNMMYVCMHVCTWRFEAEAGSSS